MYKRGCARMMGDRRNRSCHFCPSLPTRVTKAKHRQKHAREMLRSLGRSSKSLVCCYNCRNETTLRLRAVPCRQVREFCNKVRSAQSKSSMRTDAQPACVRFSCRKKRTGLAHVRLVVGCANPCRCYKTFANSPISSSQRPKAVKLW